jgi:hypothetical protein
MAREVTSTLALYIDLMSPGIDRPRNCIEETNIAGVHYEVYNFNFKPALHTVRVDVHILPLVIKCFLDRRFFKS